VLGSKAELISDLNVAYIHRSKTQINWRHICDSSFLHRLDIAGQVAFGL